jgi:hypothetical protein
MKKQQRAKQKEKYYKPSPELAKLRGKPKSKPKTVKVLIQEPSHPRIRRVRRSKRTRKVWRKGLARTETWKTGRRSVTRNEKGRWVTHHKIRTYIHKAIRKPRITYKGLMPMGKVLSVYGKARTQKGTIESRRWELIKKPGMTGDEWRGAVGAARQYPPNEQYDKRHIYADEIDDPDVYEGGGEWIDTPEIESR